MYVIGESILEEEVDRIFCLVGSMITFVMLEMNKNMKCPKLCCEVFGIVNPWNVEILGQKLFK